MNDPTMPGILKIDAPLADLELAYRIEVRWQQGLRINLDSRLLLLGLRRLINYGMISESELRHAQFVVGCRLGAMDSYEMFDESLVGGAAAPLAFAYALPSMPLACASVYYGLRGTTYTVVGDSDVGVRAFRQAVALLPSAGSRHVVVGCWETPSQTASGSNPSGHCRILLAVVSSAGHGYGDTPAPVCSSGKTDAGDCVDTLARYLDDYQKNAIQEVRHA